LLGFLLGFPLDFPPVFLFGFPQQHLLSPNLQVCKSTLLIYDGWGWK
jgi:hypothetical protein